MINSSFTEKLSEYTHQFITSTENFRLGKYNLDWLLSSSQTFWPSYQTLNLTGKNFSSKFINFYFGNKKVMKKKIINQICYRLNDGFFSPLLARGIHFDKTDLIFFWDKLSSDLSDNWPIIHQWTYTELFSFLTSYTNLFCSELNLNLNFYEKDKKEQNDFGQSSYLEIRELMLEDKLPLQHLIYLVTKANWIDNYQQNPLNFITTFSDEINDILDHVAWTEDIVKDNPLFYFDALKNDIHSSPKLFLYECDNSGEIFFDLLLIEYLLKEHHHVIVSLKEHPILNDVTYDDFNKLIGSTKFDHLKPYLKDGRLKYIKNNTCDVVCLRYLVNKDYKQAYDNASVVILKGQGHFESYPKVFNTFRKKTPIYYKNRHYHLFGIKSEHTLRSIKSLFKFAEMDQVVLLR